MKILKGYQNIERRSGPGLHSFGFSSGQHSYEVHNSGEVLRSCASILIFYKTPSSKRGSLSFTYSDCVLLHLVAHNKFFLNSTLHSTISMEVTFIVQHGRCVDEGTTTLLTSLYNVCSKL